MGTWFRVFGTNDVEPKPSDVLAWLRALSAEATGEFKSDEQGWFQAELRLAGRTPPILLDRYLTREESLRSHLNTWAAWLEAAPPNSHQERLMQLMIGTTQIFTLDLPADGASFGQVLCRFLARRTAGVYQVDGEGFFAADGTLLVPE
jgi:hypothetical protein